MNILLAGWHEPFIYNLSRMGHFFHIVEVKVLGLPRIDGKDTWQRQYRPVPENARLLSTFAELQEGFRDKAFDLVLAFNYFDLAFFKHLPLPKVYFPMCFFHDDFRLYRQIDWIYAEEIRKAILNLYDGFFPVYITREMMEKELGGTGIDGCVFQVKNGVHPEEYGEYTGEMPEVLRVGHQIRERSYYNYPLQQKVLEGIPHLILGENPGLPHARASRDWDDLRGCLRRYRVFLATYADDYALPCPTAQLEAMASGMPVVTTPHPGCLIRDGENGFVSRDPEVLRERLQLLLNDRDLAIRLGRSARRTVLETYDFARYREEWERIFAHAMKRFSAPDSPEEKEAAAPIAWEGPYITHGYWSSLNRKLVEALGQRSAILPVPKESRLGVETEAPHLAESLKVLEIMGREIASPMNPFLRVFSPYRGELLPPNAVACLQADQGVLSPEWVKELSQEAVREIWIGSEVEREHYEALGLPGRKLAVVPRGLDPVRFSPSGYAWSLPVEKKFVFLFVGSTLLLEGGDLALQAYLHEFKPEENVMLVYVLTSESAEFLESFRNLQKCGNFPEVIGYYPSTSAIHDRFFRLASFGLLPGRSLTTPRFLPDMMGCGLPVAVSGFGGSLDYREWGTLYYVPTQIPEAGGDEALASWRGAPDQALLQRLLRHAYEHPGEARIRGLIGRKEAVKKLAWTEISRLALARLRGEGERADSRGSFPGRLETAYWLDKASVHLLAREYPEARKAAFHGMSLDLENLHARALLAESQAALGEPEAASFLRDTLLLPALPRRMVPHWVKAAVHLGQTKAVSKLLEKLPDTHARLLVVLGFLESGSSREARLLAERLSGETNEPTAHAVLGVLLEEEDPLEALASYERASELDPSFSVLAKRSRETLRVAL